jgi:CheY-like chemotaxis protein
MTDLSNWNILIVDDEPDNLGVLELVLKFHKASVRIADSAQACLTILDETPINEALPSLMLVDIQMPSMSGFDLLRTLRSNDKFRGIPTIAVSAHAMACDSEKALEAGFDGYITKPISAMTFADEITMIINARHSNHTRVNQ